MRIVYIIFIIIFDFILCQGQTSDSPILITDSEVNYTNYFSPNQKIHLNYVTLVNRSKEDFYFWIGRIPSDSGNKKQLFFTSVP